MRKVAIFFMMCMSLYACKEDLGKRETNGASDFSLSLSNKTTFHLKEVLGNKVIVLNFFATWCGPCNDEAAIMNSYYKKYAKDPNFIMLGVSDEKVKPIDAFVSKHRVKFLIAYDSEGAVSDLYSVMAIPQTFLIGADGRIQYHRIGGLKNTDELRAITDKNLAAIKARK